MKIRRWAADRLVRLAYRLDPTRPSAHTNPDGGWDINVGGIPLAHVHDGAARIPPRAPRRRHPREAERLCEALAAERAQR